MSKTAIIVGASGTVGRATSSLLESEGFHLIQTTSRQNDSQKAHLNLGDFDSIESFSSTIKSVDALVITAGKEPQQNLEGLTREHFNEMIDIHYKGPLWLVKCLQKKFSSSSALVFISSVAAYKGSYDPTYSSLKSGVNGLVRTLARELSPNTTVSAVAPGLIQDSPVFDRMTDDFRSKHLNANLRQQLLTPEEVAKAVAFIIQNPQYTGQILNLNGGQYFGN